MPEAHRADAPQERNDVRPPGPRASHAAIHRLTTITLEGRRVDASSLVDRHFTAPVGGRAFTS